MESDQRVIMRFLCKERISRENIHAGLKIQFEDASSSERSVGGGASIFGGDAKTCTTRCDPAGH
jgi:hypothetical protein